MKIENTLQSCTAAEWCHTTHSIDEKPSGKLSQQKRQVVDLDFDWSAWDCCLRCCIETKTWLYWEEKTFAPDWRHNWISCDYCIDIFSSSTVSENYSRPINKKQCVNALFCISLVFKENLTSWNILNYDHPPHVITPLTLTLIEVHGTIVCKRCRIKTKTWSY